MTQQSTPRAANGRFAPSAPEVQTITPADVGVLNVANETAGAAILAEPAKKPGGKPQPHVYTGNVMYVNTDIKTPDEVYAQLMVRFVDDVEVEQFSIGVFPLKAGFTAGVGDLVVCEGRKVKESRDKDGKLNTMDDGTPVYRLAGFDQKFGLRVVSRATAEAEIVATGEIKSSRMKQLLSSVSPRLASWLGLDKPEDA